MKTFKIDSRMRDHVKNELVSTMKSDLDKAASPPRTELLIDLSENAHNFLENPFVNNTNPFATADNTISLPLPSSAKQQWWNTPLDETW
jgi:hypothetical protein